jgi:hypothetical protein
MIVEGIHFQAPGLQRANCVLLLRDEGLYLHLPVDRDMPAKRSLAQ